MSQIVERTDATTVVDGYDAIRSTVQMCLHGEATGDVDRRRAAFHPDARMFGSLAGQRYDVPITELFALAASAPADSAATAPASCPSSTCHSRRSTGSG